MRCNLKTWTNWIDPKQTGIFQALNIQTKIARTQIDIIH